MSNGIVMIIHLIVGLIEKILLQKWVIFQNYIQVVKTKQKLN